MRFAKLSADITHNHSESEKGAMVIAASIYLARKGKTKQEIKSYVFKTFNYDLILKSVKEHRDNCVAYTAGAIAESYYGGVPKHIKDFCLAKVPGTQRNLIDKFYEKIFDHF